MAKPRRARPKKSPSLPLLRSLVEPPQIRLANAGVMKAEWADPADLTPSAARSAKVIRGWRTMCPLRRCRQRCGDSSRFTAEHVMAADCLRLLHDVTKYGYSVEHDLSIPITAVLYRPSLGPSAAATQRLKCAREFSRAMGMFDAGQTELIDWTLFANKTIREWYRAKYGEVISRKYERALTRLVECLDLLVQHFGSEIRRYGPLAA